MPNFVLSPEKFREEAERRLIDRYTLMHMLGVRTRAVITARVEKGELPAPVYTGTHTHLWDRDDVLAHTDRKE